MFIDAIALTRTVPCLAAPGRIIVIGKPNRPLGEVLPYLAALVNAGRMDEARRQLQKLAELNRQGVEGEWEFNEWCQGRTGLPMGYPHQAWSAGMYVVAYHCVASGAVPILS